MPTVAPPRSRWRVAFPVAVVVNVVAVYAPSDAGGAGLLAFVPFADKLAHLLLFAAVAFTGRRAGLSAAPLFALLAVHAVTSEVAQAVLLDRRSGDPWDAVADLLGAAVGGALAGARRGPPSMMSGWRKSR